GGGVRVDIESVRFKMGPRVKPGVTICVTGTPALKASSRPSCCKSRDPILLRAQDPLRCLDICRDLRLQRLDALELLLGPDEAVELDPHGAAVKVALEVEEIDFQLHIGLVE